MSMYELNEATDAYNQRLQQIEASWTLSRLGLFNRQISQNFTNSISHFLAALNR